VRIQFDYPHAWAGQLQQLGIKDCVDSLRTVSPWLVDLFVFVAVTLVGLAVLYTARWMLFKWLNR